MMDKLPLRIQATVTTLWIKQVMLFVYWVSTSELLFIILTCESTHLAVEYWLSLTLIAGRAILYLWG